MEMCDSIRVEDAEALSVNRQTNKADRLRQIEEILWANPEGLTRAEIARRLGVDRSTISRYIDSDDLPPDIFIDESDKDRLKLDRRLQITQIVVHNLRSLVDVTLDLKSLNVMIGPNGAGKTALMEVILLLHSGANGDLSSFFDERGGFHSVISATTNQTGQPPMTVGARLAPPPHLGGRVTNFEVELRRLQIGYAITAESLESGTASTPGNLSNAEYAFQDGKLYTSKSANEPIPLPKLRSSELMLTQLPTDRPFRESLRFKEFLSAIDFYPPLQVTGRAPIRLPQPLTPATKPDAEGSNLFSVLYNLRISHPETYERLLALMRQAFPGLKRFEFPVVGAGQVTLAWYDESSKQPFYPGQLSEGTLRFLWLAAILLTPAQSSILLLDEPEVSLHPQLIRLLVALLQDYAMRSQVVVATHSSDMVRWLEPDEVIVADKEDGQTRFTRADTLDLAEWLAEYDLRDLWQMGHLGGRV